MNHTQGEGLNSTFDGNLTSQNGTALHHRHHQPPGEGLLIFYLIMVGNCSLWVLLHPPPVAGTRRSHVPESAVT